MSKLISVILVFAAVISFGVSVFADTVTTVPSSDSAAIKAVYNASETPETETIYSVDITWGSLEYTYDVKDKKTWNPERLAYDTEEGFGTEQWICAEGADTITVTNHSNTAVTATFAYLPNDSYTNISGTFNGTEDNAISLKAPDEGSDVNSAPSGNAQLVLDGSFSGEEAKTEIGSVTLTIAQKSEESAPVAVGSIKNTDVLFYETSEGIYESNTIKNLASNIIINSTNCININNVNYFIDYSTISTIQNTFIGTGSQDFTLTNASTFSLTIRTDAPPIILRVDTTKADKILTIYVDNSD